MAKILIVDDNEQNLYMLQFLLQRNGYQVVTAANGREALEKARAERPDVLITDILMPVMDGFSLCRRWQADDQLEGIPFVFYTATYTDPKDEALALRLGAERFIVKPMEPDLFVETLEDVIEEAKENRLDVPREPAVEEETVYLREYNEALVRKLEDKIAQLEAVALRQARLSAELATERRRLETTVEYIPAGILLLDAEQRILVANPAAQRYLPILTDASKGDVLAHLADRPLEGLLASSPEGLWHEIEIPGPPHRVFEVLARPVAEKKRPPEGWVLAVRDVTEERKSQERVQQQERLAAVGRLAGGIAHDFNNFLGTIMLYGNMLLYDADLSPELASAAETIVAECGRASDLVGQILDFSRRSAMEVQSVDLVSFLGEVLEILRNTLPENIRLITEIAPDTCLVHADPTRIQQVMMNLAINARDAMAEGGDLRVVISRTTVASSEDAPVAGMDPGAWVCLAVSDTGTGMTEEVKGRIFEPFFTTKERGEGTGLGLAQVYGIVTHHGGFIEVETEPDVGTTFYVYLPVHEAGQEEVAEEVSSLASGRGEVVLLVEDHENLRKAGRQTLEALGYRALTAANGREALDTLQEAAVDLVITDVVMPDMGGEALMQALSEMYPDLPVLAFTGYRFKEDHQRLREAGFAEVLLKPLDASILARAMRRALDEG